MEFKITRANIKSNFFLYKIYFFATTIILSIFAAFLNFTSDRVILDRISEGGRVETMANTIYIFLLILLVFFLIYFNHFFLKNRSREIGILALLGFSKRKLIKMLCYESVIVLSLSYISSIILGAGIYFGIETCIIRILKLNINANFYINSHVILKLLVITVLVFVINMFINSILVMSQSLIEFVHYSKKNEKRFKVRPFMSILAFMCIIGGYLICFLSFWGINGIWKVGVTPVFTIAILLIGFGTIMLIRFGLIYVIELNRKNKNKLYTPVGNIIYPKLIFRISTKNKLLTVLSLLLTLTVTIVGIMTFTLVYPMRAIDRLNPSAIEYNYKNSMIQDFDLSKIANENRADVLKVDILRINTSPSIPITENGSKKIDYFDIVKFSDYKKLMINQGRKSEIETLKGNGYLLINYYPTQKPLDMKFVLPNNDNIYIQKVSTNNIFSFANSVTTLIVDDAYYNKLKNENIGKHINIMTLNGDNLRDSKKLYEPFKNIKDLQSSYLKKYTIVRDNSSTFIFISFIAILLVICTASILYFTNLIEIMENEDEYNYLKKIGYSKVQINGILKKEIGILYKIPLILGIFNGGFMLFAFRFIFIDNLIGSKDLITTTLITLLLFTGFYFAFYHMAKMVARKILRI